MYSAGVVEAVGSLLTQRLGIRFQDEPSLDRLSRALDQPTRRSYTGSNGDIFLHYETTEETGEYLLIKRGDRNIEIEEGCLRISDPNVRGFLSGFLFVEGEGLQRQLREAADGYADRIRKGEHIEKIDIQLKLDYLEADQVVDFLPELIFR